MSGPMNFDESELRAALREGEGAGRVPNAGAIMARAAAARDARRTRLRNGAAALVVVGALGTGLGVLTTRGGGGGDSAGSAGSAAGPAAGAVNGAAAAPDRVPSPAPSPGPSRKAGVAGGSGTGGGAGSGAGACPSHPAGVTAPRPGAPGADGRLFAPHVASLTVCGYRAARLGGTYTLRGSTTVEGTPARRLADSLESPSTKQPAGRCPGTPRPVVLTVYARTSAGARLPVVVVDETVPCPITISNGTAARHMTAKTLPGSLATLAK